MVRRRLLAAAFSLLAAPAAASESAPAVALPAKAPPEPLALRVGRILPVTAPPIDDGTILLRDGKIEALGKAADVAIPAGYRVIDARDEWAFPGFVDLHAHIASEQSSDLNDTVYQINTDLRNLDVIVPGNEDLVDAVRGGVTTILFIPGSGSNSGGFGTLLKTAGDTLEEMVIRFPGALKIAQAGNPERRAGDLGAGRMGMNWMIRNVLDEGRRYHEAWTAHESGAGPMPERVLRLDLVRGLFQKKYPILVHTQIFQVVQSTMRIPVDEFGLWVIVSHASFDGYKNAPELGKRDVYVNCGPREYDFNATGLRRFVGFAAEYVKGGVPADRVSINTDSPVVPEEHLFLQAAMAVRFGLDHETALRAVTINGARAIGIGDRVGSLEPGKDADVVLKGGDPLDPRYPVVMTIVNGRIVHDARDAARN
jgi:imidazolonepropionase-like amidohydrolase